MKIAAGTYELTFCHFHGHAVLNAFEFSRAYICFDSDQTRPAVCEQRNEGKKQNTCKIKSHLKSIRLLQFKTVMICSLHFFTHLFNFIKKSGHCSDSALAGSFK